MSHPLTLDKSNITDDLLGFIYEHFMIDPAQEKIDLDVSLILTGVMDSTGLLELVTFIEKKWRFKIPPEEVTQTNFGSVRKIASFIGRSTDRRKT